MEESSKTFEQTAVECQLTDAKNLQIMAELRSDIKKYMELSKNSEAAMDTEKTKLEAELVQLKEKNDENEGKYHSTYEELMELKDALYKLGIEVNIFMIFFTANAYTTDYRFLDFRNFCDL